MNPLAAMSLTDWLLTLAAFAIVCVVAHYADRRARKRAFAKYCMADIRFVSHRLTPRETEKRKCEKHHFVFHHVAIGPSAHVSRYTACAVYECSACGRRIRLAMHRHPKMKGKGKYYDQV